MGLVLTVVVVLAVLAAALLLMPQPTSKFHPGTLSLQAIVTVMVAVVAGYWYLIERRGTPHANVELSATGVRLDSTTALVQARITIQNNGQILLEPQEWEVRLLSVVPPRSFPLKAVTKSAVEGYDQWPATLADTPAYFYNELQWSALRRFNGPAEHKIEPGERDVRTFDLLVPCTVKTAKLTIALRKPRPEWWQDEDAPGGAWWKDRMLIALAPLCRSEVGSVRSLDDGTNRKGDEL